MDAVLAASPLLLGAALLIRPLAIWLTARWLAVPMRFFFFFAPAELPPTWRRVFAIGAAFPAHWLVASACLLVVLLGHGRTAASPPLTERVPFVAALREAPMRPFGEAKAFVADVTQVLSGERGLGRAGPSALSKPDGRGEPAWWQTLESLAQLTVATYLLLLPLDVARAAFHIFRRG